MYYDIELESFFVSFRDAETEISMKPVGRQKKKTK